MEKKKETSNLQNFASPLMAKNHFIKASFGGFAGSGKTFTAANFIVGIYKDLKIEKPLLFIDNEKGSRFLIHFFKDSGIETLVKETVQLADVVGAFNYLNSGEVGFLFIDSLTKVYYQYIKDYKSLNKRTFMTMQDWGKVTPDWQEKFSNPFVELNGNCVFTGRGGFTYEMEENEETKKKEFVKTGVKMKMPGETPFEPDLNIWMELQQEVNGKGLKVWREAQIMKDRSGTIDGKTFKNPTYKDFQPIVKYILGTPIGAVAGATSDTNLAPVENFETLRMREEKEILFSEIKGVFDLHGLGGNLGKELKELKTTLINTIFETTAFERIQKLDNQLLLEGKAKLNHLFTELVDVVPEQKINFVKDFDLSKIEITIDNVIPKEELF